MVWVSNMLIEGPEEQRNVAGGIEWLRRAVDLGNADAMANLGIRHMHGTGVEQDFEKAAGLLQRAIEGGSVGAYRVLAILHFHGQGVEKDVAKAIRLFRLGAAGGDPLAMLAVGNVYARGEGTPVDFEKAREWFAKAAAAGVAEGHHELGRLHEFGRGTETDMGAALGHYRRGAEAGHPDSLARVGFACFDGDGTKRDRADAVRWLTRAAAAEQSYAVLYLSLALRSLGRDVEALDVLRIHKAKTGHSDWLHVLLSFLAGDLTTAELHALADAPESKRLSQRCEAHFYAGALALLAGDRPAAKAEFEACIATGKTTYVEHRSATLALQGMAD